jgi:SOS-response transcriptional repressor LexA
VESLGLDTTHLGDPRSTIIHRVGAPGFEDPRVSAGDLVVADRAVRPDDGDLVIAVIGGEKVVRLFRVSAGREYLLAGGEAGGGVEVSSDARVEILASVVSVIPIIQEP